MRGDSSIQGIEDKTFIEALCYTTPEHCYSTDDLVAPVVSRMSDELRHAVAELRIDQRYSAVAELPEYLAGRRPLSVSSGTTMLAARAARRCLDESGMQRGEVGLLIAASNSQQRILPGLAPDLIAALPDRLSPSIASINMQGQGCSSLLKAIEVARWFLASHPQKKVLVVISEVQTPYMQRYTDGL